MSQVPNTYNNNSGPQHSNPGTFQPYNHIPGNQLPGTIKQDGNLNSAVTMAGLNSQSNHYNQSANSSPAFNRPGMMPPSSSQQASPLKSSKPLPNHMQNIHNIPQSLASSVSAPNFMPAPAFQPPHSNQRHINNNAPPLISSSQHTQPLVNGPSGFASGPPRASNQYPVSSSSFSPVPLNQTSASPFGPIKHPQGSPVPLSQPSVSPYQPINLPPGIPRPPTSMPPGPMISQSMPYSGAPVTGHRNSPLISGPPTSIPPVSSAAYSGPYTSSVTSPPTGLSTGPPIGLPTGPLTGLPTGPPIGLPAGPPRNNFMNGPQVPDLPMAPSQMGPRNLPSGPSSLPTGPVTQQSSLYNNGPASQIGPNYLSPTNAMSGPQSIPSGPTQGPNMPISQDPLSGPPSMSGPPRTNFQNRYPAMPPSNLTQQQMQIQQNIAKQFPKSAYTVTQQMGQLSVTKHGFDQLWGHQMVDLLQCRHILPEYPEDPPEIKLGHQFAESSNCSPEIFRSTINRIPETNALLQKSRLPLGILIHPFKDLNHLPVIQCTTIVRCRACRTYINPFVYFVDAKRWKCNLCYRVNDLPEEFQYDPVSKTYGDPSRRPEIKSATIEFIAPSEYMLRPPQPAVYLFLFDVSQIARDSGYLQVVCDTLKENLDQLPGDARTQIGVICFDAHIHYYLMSEGLTRPKEMTVIDIDDIFLPSPESLLVNLGENREMVRELLCLLPQRFSAPGVPASALGAALQAAYKLMAPTGGRITVFQTCLPNIGPGALQSREDPNARSAKEVSHLNPATDFYKRLALDCSGAQVTMDLFLLSAQYADLASLSGMAKFSAGSVHHIPLFRAARAWQAQQLQHMLTRYLARKIGFEAVMRVRCTRGIGIHTFHGNFFVRSTDLLSLPNVSPDAGFGMQLTIEESLSDLQQVCFQAALLYTSSKGERRIRVHTLALPIATTLPDVLHSADQLCIIGLLSKMAVDRCVTASMSEAREALMNVAVDVLSAHRLAQNLPAGTLSSALQAPLSLRLLPLYILALLKRKAFRTGTSTRLDDRVADMCLMKSAPLPQLLRAVYPDLYAVHRLHEHEHEPRAVPDLEPQDAPDPPRMHLTAERINSDGAYLLDDGETMILYVCHGVSPAFLSEVFGVAAFSQLPDEARALPRLETDGSELLHAFLDKLNDERPYPSNVLILRDNSTSKQLFTERLIDDRVESAFSYYEFLQHIKNQVK